MASTYDFVIVGGGTAGCLLAHRLSHSPSKPSVLLLEAGSNPTGDFLRAPFHRYWPSVLRPDLDHGYVSEPEPTLGGRTIAYTRGKGLGGSSAVNFGVYLYGSGADYDKWADLVGDASWEWESVKKSFAAIENYDFKGSEEWSHLADPSKNAHGTSGALKVGLPPVLEKGVQPQMEALRDAGDHVNLDPNSGDPVGLSVFPYSYSKEGRTTSAIAHLVDPPSNLTVWTDATVDKLVFEGTKVTGVVTGDGRQATASKEVVLSGGSIDTPKLLLLNGVGPKDELEALGISVKLDRPGVGKHLKDHVLTFMSVEIDGSANDRYNFESNEALVAEADKLWKQDQSGAFSLQHSALWGGFLKHPDITTFPEYKELPEAEKEFLSKANTPHYEFISNCALWPPGAQLTPGNSYMTFVAFLMNPQSEGSVSLRSSSAAEKPVIKLNYLEHAFDKRMMREAVRLTWQKHAHNPTISPQVGKTLCGPVSLSDEDIDAFLRDTASTVWHANGTAKMGKLEDAQTVVDSEFRVVGLQGLRIADLSVCPLTTNNHTQATAYLVGQKAAEKLIAEYDL